GRPIPRDEAAPLSEDWPHIGAVLARLNRGRERSPLPPFIQMRPEVPEGAPRFVEQSHGQGAGWLGPAWNPMTIDDDPNRPGFRTHGAAAVHLPDDLSPGRLDDRRRLLHLIDRQARELARSATAAALDAHYARACTILTDRAALEAFDLDREDPRLR